MKRIAGAAGIMRFTTSPLRGRVVRCGGKPPPFHRYAPQAGV